MIIVADRTIPLPGERHETILYCDSFGFSRVRGTWAAMAALVNARGAIR